MRSNIDRTENAEYQMILSLRKWYEVIAVLEESNDDLLIRDIKKAIPQHASIDNGYQVWCNEEDYNYIDEIAFS